MRAKTKALETVAAVSQGLRRESGDFSGLKLAEQKLKRWPLSIVRHRVSRRGHFSTAGRAFV